MSSRDKQEWIGAAFVGIGLGVMALFGALAAASATMGAAAIPVWAITAALVFVVSRSSVARAFAGRLSSRHADDGAIPGELYAELDELRARVLELEERQDFAERLLAQEASSPASRRGE